MLKLFEVIQMEEVLGNLSMYMSIGNRIRKGGHVISVFKRSKENMWSRNYLNYVENMFRSTISSWVFYIY